MRKDISHTQKVLNLWAIVLIAWSIYRMKFGVSLPLLVDEFIAKPLIFVLPVYLFITNVEKADFFKGLDLKFSRLFTDIILGVGIGAVFFLTGMLGNIVKFKTFWPTLQVIFSQENTAVYIFAALATGITEEILSRGFVLKRLYAESKNMLTSSFLASVLFFFLHIPILFSSEKIIGIVLLRIMIMDLILSLAVSFIYLERKSLILPILIHAFYTLSIQMLV